VAALHDDIDAARRLVTDEAPAADDQPAFAGWLQRMCRAAARSVPAKGVGVSLVNDDGVLITAAASDETSVVVEELQFTLGEGPCLAAFASRSPVLVSDLDETASTTWPAYAGAALEHGVRSVFAFPLQIGVMRLGALDVYREEAGPMSQADLSRALAFAEVAMETLLDVGASTENVDGFLDDIADSGYRVYQAQGMVMIQLGVSAQEALLRLRAHAYSHERRLSQVAEDVVARRLTFSNDEATDTDDTEGRDRR
jgi:hypothetical protein